MFSQSRGSAVLFPLFSAFHRLISIIFFSRQCSGSLIRSVWLTSAPCGVMLRSSSASSPRWSRSMSAWCPGRKTPSPSSQVRKKQQNPNKQINKTNDHLQGQLARSPFYVTSSGLSLLLVFDCVRSIRVYVLVVFDQVAENNWKQIIQFHPNLVNPGVVRAFPHYF